MSIEDKEVYKLIRQVEDDGTAYARPSCKVLKEWVENREDEMSPEALEDAKKSIEHFEKLRGVVE